MISTLAILTMQNAGPAWFWVALGVGAAAILGFTYMGIWRRSGRRLTWTLLALRLAGVAALFVALLKPVWTQTTQRSERPEVAVVLDDSQSMSLPYETGTPGPAASRYKQATAWITNSEAGKALNAAFDVSVYDLAGEKLDPRKLPVEPTEEQTDLMRALRSAASRLRGHHVAGVILISDGRDTTGRQDYMSVQDLGVTVSALGFKQKAAGGEAAMDLAILDVDAPQRVLVHNQVTVKVRIGKNGGPAAEFPVLVEHGDTTQASKRLSMPAGSSQANTTITFTPDTPGDFVMAARIPQQAGQRSGANNARFFKLRVEVQPIRVLYVEGYLRPEATFLKERLSNDPDVSLISIVRSVNPDTAGAGTLLGGELFDAERLKKVDVILLGDFESRLLEDSAYASIKAWVEAGGGLMVLGGYHNLASGGLPGTVLADVLPIETTGGTFAQLDVPFAFKLTEEGKRFSALAVTGDMERDAAAWSELPKLRGIVATPPARPGATVLARFPAGPTPDVPGYVVLATQRFGKGVSVLMTADTTWRWSRFPRLEGRPDTMYVRFWSQMVRYLAHRDDVHKASALTVNTDAPDYDRGQRVTIQVRRNPEALVPGAAGADDAKGQPTVDLSVRSPDDRLVPVTVAQSASPNLWTATFFPDRGGRFEVTARLVGHTNNGDQPVASQVAEFLVHGSGLELDDPSTDPALLGLMARNTGGTYADIDDGEAAGKLVAAIPTTPTMITQTRQATVWNNPLFFLIFLACVSGEWIIRRRNQLV